MKKILIIILLLGTLNAFSQSRCHPYHSLSQFPTDSVELFQKYYTGITSFQNNRLTISSSGYLNMSGKPDQNLYFAWNVPENVHEIVIAANTIVNAGFYYNHGLKIRGVNRKTSIIYGTQEEDWNLALQDNTGQNCDWFFPSIWVFSGNQQESEISNLTFLNPKVFAIRAMDSNRPVNVFRCNFIDNRNGTKNNSDGIDTSTGSRIEDCYFETKDDNIKVYRPNLEVHNCTFNMIDNSVPFQLGWGNYAHNASLNASNIRIMGHSGRYPNPIIDTGVDWNTSTNPDPNSHITIDIEGMKVENNAAYLYAFRHSYQHLNGSIKANLNGRPHWFWGDNRKYAKNTWQENISEQFSNSRYYGGSSVSSYDFWNDPELQFARNFVHRSNANNNAAYIRAIDSSISMNNCPRNLSLTQTINSTEYHNAQNSITATNTIQQPGKTTYKAGKKVILKSGFKALQGSYLKAHIGPCSNNWTNPQDNSESTNRQVISDLNKNIKDREELLQDKLSVQVFPNPFTDLTKIRYQLPKASEVNITLFDPTGKQVQVLVHRQPIAKGEHQVSLSASNLAKGIYYVRVQSELETITKKVIITN